MSSFLQPNPFEILKTVVRKWPKLDRMYDHSKRDEYDRIHRAASELREQVTAIRANKAIDFSIRNKSLDSALTRAINYSTWFKTDQLEYGNNILKQFETAITHLLESEEIVSHEVENMKEARDDYVVWLETHQGMISFTYVLHNNIMKYIKDESISKTESGFDAILEIIIKESVKLCEAVESVKMINKQHELLNQDREAKLRALQSKINEVGEWK